MRFQLDRNGSVHIHKQQFTLVEIMSENNTYSLTLKYSIGVTSGLMSWDISRALDGDLLDELLTELKEELGTNKDVFVESIKITGNTETPLNKYLSNLDLGI